MSFIRTRTIKGRKYRYKETRWREGGKVRSHSQYLGYAEGLLGGSDPIPDHGRGQHGLEALHEAAEAARDAAKETPADVAGGKEASTPSSGGSHSSPSEADASDSGAGPQ